ncbi:MAG TPA: histidine kinase [Opitutaceae bacterium]|nr:histidine kinase [Opitutaceae bacterium]
MKKKVTSPSKAAALRRLAKSRLRKLQGHPGRITSDSEVRRLVHELQVHQIELELQNEELKQSAHVARLAVEKFTDLYDFAPIGYFSLDPDGRIMEVNLTGTVMFGIERSGLIQRRFQLFVEEGSRKEFNEFLGKTFKTHRKRACEMRLVKANRSHFWADLEAIVTTPGIGGVSWCRVAVVDISARKHAAEVQLRLEIVAASNRKLEREILQRRKAESALRRSDDESLRLLEESRRLQEQLRNLAHQILRAQEEERKLISRELHDEISQVLVGINVHLSLLRETSVAIPAELRRQFARTQRLVEKSVDIVHEFARKLRPPQLDDLGLIPALRSFLNEFSERTGITVQLKVFAGVESLGNNRRTVLYRVAQEAVINVGKHAQATSMSVSISKVPGAVSMEISDNGKSFAVEETLTIRKNRRLGLVGMRERVEMVGGRFGIESELGKGTTIQILIPFRAGGGGNRARSPGEAPRQPARMDDLQPQVPKS